MSEFITTAFLVVAGAFALWLLSFLIYFSFTPSLKKQPPGEEKNKSAISKA
jgi:hypothetical protein